MIKYSYIITKKNACQAFLQIFRRYQYFFFEIGKLAFGGYTDGFCDQTLSGCMSFTVKRAVSVLLIPHDRITEVSEVSTDLVRFARMQRHFEQRRLPSSLEHTVFRHDFLSARSIIDCNARRPFVLFEICVLDGVFFPHRPCDKRMIPLLHVAVAKGIEEQAFRPLIAGKDHDTLRVSVETVNEVRLSRPLQSAEHRFRLNAALFVDDNDVFVLVENGKGKFLLLRSRQKVLHAVPLLERDVAIDFDAVDPYLSVFQQRAQDERSLRVMFVCEVLQRRLFAYDVFSQNIPSRA